MSTETFTCYVLQSHKAGYKIQHNGKTAFMPVKQVEYIKHLGDGRSTITIPKWLYDKEF